MTKEEKTQLMKLIYKLDVLGDNNSIVRRYYDINTKKEWRSFINNYIKLLDKVKAVSSVKQPMTSEEGFDFVLDRYVKLK